MNINLKKIAQSKKKVLTLGLNVPTASSAFQRDNGSSSEDDQNDVTGRQAVNRSIAKEQAALRIRAAASAREVGASAASLFDYDGAYDSFRLDAPQHATKDNSVDSKKSRYIGDLLKTADKRKHERDIAYERKIAREQAAEEDADPEYRGKEKFVTAAYKEKLEERKVWQVKDDEQQKKEEANDVTKRSDGLGMASFYGNLTRHGAMGGRTTADLPKQPQSDDDEKTNERQKPRGGDDDDPKRWKDDITEHRISEVTERKHPPVQNDVNDTTTTSTEDLNERRKRIRLERETKVEQARVRYFERQACNSKRQIEAS